MINQNASCIRNLFGRSDPLADKWASADDIFGMDLTVANVSNFGDAYPGSIGGCVVGAVKTRRGICPLIDRSDEHIVAIGPCRSGKSASLVIPTLLQWVGSAIIHDVAGECHEATAGWRGSVARNRIVKFDPHIDDGSSARYNPLCEVRVGTNRAFGDALEIAQSLVDLENTRHARFDNAIRFLHSILIYVLHIEADKTLHGAAFLLRDIDRSKLLDKIAPVVSQYDESGKTLIGHLANFSEDDLAVAKCLVMSQLSCFLDPVIQAATASSDFAINDLMNANNPISLYLIVKPWRAEATSPLMRIVLVQAMSRLAESHDHKHKLLLMFDGFGTYGGINRFDFCQNELSALIDCGIKCYFCMHNVSESNDSSASLAVACKIRVILPQSSIDSAKFCAHLVETHAAEVLCQDGEELLRMQSTRLVNGFHQGADILVLVDKQKPIKTIALLYFSNPMYKSRTSIKIEDGVDSHPAERGIPAGEGTAQ